MTVKYVIDVINTAHMVIVYVDYVWIVNNLVLEFVMYRKTNVLNVTIIGV